jgi:hypothetical protein
MASNFHDALDPLDLEILERALDGALETLKEDEAPADLDSDEALKGELRQELVEIARLHGVNDPETLRDILLVGLAEIGDDGSAKPLQVGPWGLIIPA